MRLVGAGKPGSPALIAIGSTRRAGVLIAAGVRGPAGAGGVASFNERLGAVVLSEGDVAEALGYTPANDAELAEVAKSGSFNDLADLPDIPATPADIGAATSAQGSKADTALQPGDLDDALDGKVDKVAGRGLSENNFTDALYDKLAALESSHFRGAYLSAAALASGVASPLEGDYAHVDEGEGEPVQLYIWDESDQEWVNRGESAGTITAAQVLELLTDNDDVNILSDDELGKLTGIEAGAQANHAAVTQTEAEAGTGTALKSWTVQRVWQAINAWWAASAMKTKLDGIAAGATANATNAQLRDRSTHTGTQAASTISDLAEVTQDMVGAMIVAGSNISVSYNDAAGTLTISATGGGGSGIAPVEAVAAVALAAGEYVNLYLDSTTLKARKAGGSGKYQAQGFVKQAYDADDGIEVYPLAANNDALSSLILGSTYYLSTSTAGTVQTSAPASSGVLRQELGVAVSATELMHTNSLAVELE